MTPAGHGGRHGCHAPTSFLIGRNPTETPLLIPTPTRNASEDSNRISCVLACASGQCGNYLGLSGWVSKTANKEGCATTRGGTVVAQPGRGVAESVVAGLAVASLRMVRGRQTGQAAFGATVWIREGGGKRIQGGTRPMRKCNLRIASGRGDCPPPASSAKR